MNVRPYFITFAISTFLILTACTGSSIFAKKPVDTEPIWGARGKRVFFNTLNETTANVLLIPNNGGLAQWGKIQSNTFTLTASIPVDSVHISSDGTVATITNQEGIYQESSTDMSSAISGSAPLPLATVDAYCNAFSVNGYSEVTVQSTTDGEYSFTATGNNQSTLIGVGSPLEKSQSGGLVTYQLVSQGMLFGSLQIDTSEPLVGDSAYFKANLAISADSDWQSVAVYCHLNNVSVE